MNDVSIMRRALALAARGYGFTSPNPMVGAVLLKGGKIIGEGWHRRAGEPHAEVEAIRDATRRGCSPRGAVLYVTLEPCSTHGRTPPCTGAILDAGIKRVVIGTSDPNPAHAGRAFEILVAGGIRVVGGVLGENCAELNEPFNHWIVNRTPYVTVKSAMSVDGRIAVASGESKWITSAGARREVMRLRQGADAILVGANTVVMDDPSLTIRGLDVRKVPRRIILDTNARTPLDSQVLTDEFHAATTVVVGRSAPAGRVGRLARRVNVIRAPVRMQPTGAFGISLPWLLKRLGAEEVTHLLVEGGGEVNASFLLAGLAHRVAFFYAPKILGGRRSPRAVGGEGVESVRSAFGLTDVDWRRIGSDFLLQARVRPPAMKK